MNSLYFISQCKFPMQFEWIISYSISFFKISISSTFIPYRELDSRLIDWWHHCGCGWRHSKIPFVFRSSSFRRKSHSTTIFKRVWEHKDLSALIDHIDAITAKTTVTALKTWLRSNRPSMHSCNRILNTAASCGSLTTMCIQRKRRSLSSSLQCIWCIWLRWPELLEINDNWPNHGQLKMPPLDQPFISRDLQFDLASSSNLFNQVLLHWYMFFRGRLLNTIHWNVLYSFHMREPTNKHSRPMTYN